MLGGLRFVVFCVYRHVGHRVLHVLKHSFPTRRSSDRWSARLAMSTGCWPVTIGKVVTFAWVPSTASCSCAAGRATSSDAIITFLRPLSVRRLAILAVEIGRAHV